MRDTSSEKYKADFFIMRVLYESSSGLQPYTLLKRSRLSGEVFFKVFSSLVSKSLVYEKNSLIFLSARGREIFLAGSGRVMATASKPWRKIPEGMLCRKMAPGELYAPNIFFLNL